MKTNKKRVVLISLLLFLLAGLYSTVRAQDIGINIALVPGTILLNGTGQVQVDICNNDAGSTTLASYKVRPLISMPPSLVITGVSGLPAGWSICSNNGTDIRLSNGTHNIPPLDCATFYIDVMAVDSLDGLPRTITGSLFFAGGTAATACSNGIQTTGNIGVNDNSTAGVIVSGVMLPVTLSQFSAEPESGCRGVALHWQTASERSSKDFIIQRSRDGKSWSVIGVVAAVGNSSAPHSYSYTDKEVAGTGVWSYRLQQNDLSGEYEYSRTLTVRLDCSGNGGYYVHPNPVSDLLTIQAPSSVNAGAVVIYNTAGQQVAQQQLVAGKVQTLNTAEWTPGAYTVVITEDGRQVHTEKIIKQ